MDQASFPILVPYKGEMVIATATKVDHPLMLYYQVNFPDGYSDLFHTYEGDRGWAEAEVDVTDLAKEVGPIIDMYRHEKYFQPFFVTSGDSSYAIQPFTEDDGRTIKYEVYARSCEHLLNIFPGENGEWDYEQVSENNDPGYKNLAIEIGDLVKIRE